ncbi:MAG: DUF2961 domain-containing protein [Armatimonadetes bacterium]|nr:DUF2961 domain-containing protein [Armatimonadota bacterium]
MPASRLLVLLTLACLCTAAHADTLDYCTLLDDLVNLDKLPLIEPGVRCREWTSFDRAEYTRPGANGDAGHYVRVEPDGEAVMAEMTGPGCIVRLWSANPQGRIRFYLDGAATPQYEFDFDELFRGTIPPFKTPVVYKQGARQSASDCYLPIPYAQSCKVTADKKWGQYYHIWFRTYPPDWQVPTFRLPLSAAETAALDRVCEAWNRMGERPRPADASARVVKQDAVLQPGETLSVPRLKGPGVIQALKLKADGDERYVWRKMWLEARWDGADTPALAAPLDGLFGTGYQANDYKSLPAGVVDGQGYLYFPMPFRKSADLKLTNQGHKPVTVALELTVAGKPVPDNATVFHAKWRREQATTTFDYPFLEATGAGKVVGVSLNIDNPLGGWWGEGDEKLVVDGRSWDELIGTGSEDYFGDAWGLHRFQQPFFGVSYLTGSRTCAYRWHIVDNVPFEQSVKFTIENYPPFRPDYTSTCFWYATPEATDSFAPATEYAVRRPWGKSLANTIEAEDLQAGLGGTVIDDEDRPAEFSRGLALDLGTKAAGDELGPVKIALPAEDAYYPIVYMAPEGATAMNLLVDGQPLKPSAVDAARGTAEYPGVWLAKGEHELKWRYAAAGPSLVDCLQMRPSPKPRNVAEAESVKVTSTSGPAPQVEQARLMWGHGKQLLFPAAKADDSFTVELPARGAQVLLGAMITRQSDYGDFQACVGDQPIGPVISAYSATPTTGQVTLGKLDLAKPVSVTIRVVGKDEAATGFAVGVDYFTFAPILIPDAIEAEELKVVEHEGGGAGRQDLGDRFSSGGQLFFTNSKPDGHVTVEFTVAREGDYEVNLYFCTSWDYAIVQPYLDDVKIGDPLDNYTPSVVARGKSSFGVHHLTAGPHRLKLQSVGKNEQSKGYYMGLDAIQLLPQ